MKESFFCIKKNFEDALTINIKKIKKVFFRASLVCKQKKLKS